MVGHFGSKSLQLALLLGIFLTPGEAQICNDTIESGTPVRSWPFNFINGNLGLTCPNGWEMRGVTCYNAEATKAAWTDASKTCSSYGGALAKVTSFDMNLAVVEYAKEVIADGSTQIWTGLYRKPSDTANTVTWALRDEDTDMSVGRWAAGQPDLTKGSCVAVDLSGDSHLWSFTFCNEKLPFVCQIPALPPGEFLCKDGTTVSEVRVCNQIEDCADASDEVADLPACASVNLDFLTMPGDITSDPYTDKGSTWILQAALGQIIQLTIKTVDTELNVDLVEVYVGGSSIGASIPVGVISGKSNVPTSYVSPNNWLIVRLSVDDTVGGDGWTGTWATEYTCEMKALEGYYQMGSVLAGPSVMTADACQSSCFGNAACNAASFSKSGGTCTTYRLFEERFKNADSTYYAKTCPGEAGATKKPNVPNGGGTVMVTGCTHVYSPFYPVQLLSGLSLSWTLQGGEFDTLTVEVIEVALGPGDQLRIYDGGSTADIYVEFTNEPNEDWDRFFRFLFSSGNRALVTLDTTLLGSRYGFQLKVCLGCRAEMSQYTGYIRTPNVRYPPDQSPDYSRLITCEWIIKADGKLVTFKTVPGITNAIATTNGTNDKYEVYEGEDDTGTLLQSGTDADNIAQIKTTQDVYIRFVSDAAFTAAGFALRYYIGCTDHSVSNTSTQWILFDSLSPPYPTAHASYFDLMCLDGYNLNREMYTYFDNGTMNPDNTLVRLYCNDYSTWYMIPPTATNITDESKEIQDTAFPMCVEKYCGSPYDQVINGHIFNMTSPVFGGVANFNCFEGFTLTKPDRNASTDCSAAGTWSNLPTCEAETCAPLTGPVYGNLTLVRGNGTAAGSVYKVSCDDGYVYEGVTSLYCQNGGNWSAEVGTCQVLSCLVPEVQHATHDMSPANGPTPGVILANVTVAYVCEDGYAFPNNSANYSVGSITCLGSNRWNHPVPKCEDVDECANATWCDQSCINYPGSFQCFCHPPTYLDTADNRTCIDADECSLNTHLCSANSTCIDRANGHNCTCSSGYRLANEIDVFPGETGMDSWNLVRVNQSCVVDEACMVPNVTDAKIAPSRTSYYHFQEVKIVCDEGFVMNTSVTQEISAVSAFCLRSTPTGIWTDIVGAGQDLDIVGCFPAMCPELNTSSAINPPTVVPSGPVGFQESVTLVCSISGGASFNRTRTCLYNSQTQKYELMGDLVDCGEIICPVLDSSVAPGSDLNTTFATFSNADRTFNQTFTFGCVNGSTPLGNSSIGNTVVTCQSNGNWDLGSLRCPGLAVCSDPGTPAGATLTANNDGYYIDATVTFTCSRDGFGFPATNSSKMTLTCVSTDSGVTANWTMVTPSECEDIVPPDFNYCPSMLSVKRFEPFNITSQYPRATDNSGYVSITLSEPSELYPGQVTDASASPYTITWVASDGANNTATCNTTIQVIESSATTFATCTTNRSVVELSDATPSVTLIIDTIANFTVDMAFIVNTRPVSLTLDATSLYQTNFITTMATSPRSPGAASTDCYTTITAVPAQCSKLELGEPANGTLACSGTPSTMGYTCILTCEMDHYLQGVPSNTITYTCSNCSSGNEWQRDGQPDNWVPDCIASSGKPSHKLPITVTYSTSPTGGWDPTCDAAAQSALDQKITDNDPGQTIVQLCNTFGFTEVSRKNSNHAITTSALSATVKIDVELEGQEASDCAGALTNVLNDVAKFNARFPNLESVPLSASPAPCTSVTIVPSDFAVDAILQVCPDGQNLQNDKCLPCPPGTYFNGTDCERCPADKYTDTFGSTMCKSCPANTATLGMGASSMDMCIAECGENTYSATGLPPCLWCPKDTFWVNSTTCENCPTSTTSGGAGQKNVGMCRAVCPGGSWSVTGSDPCTPCPQGTYSDTTTSCAHCPDGMTTSGPGDSERNNCTTPSNLPIPSCDFCNKQGSCTLPSSATTYRCDCDPGYTGGFCEQILPDPCASNPCFNDGTCMYNSSSGNYKCHCTQDDEVTYTEHAAMTVSNGMFLGRGDDSSKANCQQSCTDNANCNHVAYSPRNSNSGSFNCFLYMGGGLTAAPQDNDVFQQSTNTVDLFTGTHCEADNINACSSGPCMNNASCENTIAFPDGFKCYCNNIGDTVYTGDRCQTSTDVCSVPANVCMNDGTCVPIASFRRHCDCKPGYTGDNCETDIDECQLYNNPCFNGGNCTEKVDGFQCQCPHGFSGTYCEKKDVSSACSNIDCSPGMCVLDPVTNMPFCSCAEGLGEGFWTGWVSFDNSPGTSNDEEQVDKIQRREFENYTMSYWSNGVPRWIECRDSVSNLSWVEQVNDTKGLQANPCSPKLGLVCDVTREDDDYCLNYEQRFFFEMTCPQSCSSINDCAVNPCFHGGTCVDATPGFTCKCPSGYEGTVCQHPVDPCTSSPCTHQGTCETIPEAGYNCTCVEGYTGTHCETNMDDCSCDPWGTERCEDLLNGFQCHCKSGFFGNNCSVDINECASNPCLNGGNCTDQVNGFQCTCPPGWTGSNCQDLVPSCAGSTCLNGGTCFDQIGDFICACVAGTFGMTCDQQPDVCGVANPCINGGTCSFNSGVANCTCPAEFTGDGCQFVKDSCFRHNCVNGATCQPHATGYDCLCIDGWTGAYCETKIDPCQDIDCGSNSYCALGLCVCTGTFTGPACDKVATRDYDIVHCGAVPTRLTGGFEFGSVGVTAFSLNVWVRYLEPASNGTFVQLVEVASITDPSFVKNVVSLDQIGSTFDTGNEELTVAYGASINDGAWHNVIVTWDGTTLTVYAAGAIAKATATMSVTLPLVASIQLGSGGFKGWTSQVILFNSSVEALDTIEFGKHPDVYPSQYGIHHDWTGYIIGGCARRSTPSVAYQPSENPDSYTPVTVTDCPKSASVYTEDLTAMLDWTPPTFKDSIMVAHNYMPSTEGGVFAQGVYDVAYLATSANPGGVICAFPGYVKLGNCPTPVASPSGTIMDCYTVDAEHQACWVSCPAGKAFLRQVPKLYTCGPSGVWDTDNPFAVFAIPHCGVANNGMVALKVFWKLGLGNVGTSPLANYKSQLKTKVDTWATSGGVQEGLCAAPPCSNIAIDVVVLDASSRSVEVTVTMDPVPAQLGPMADVPVQDVVSQAATVDGAFYVTTVIGADSFSPGSFGTTVKVSCPTGSEPVGGMCVTCTPGTYWDDTEKKCVDCALGTYQTMDNQTSCTPCVAGSTTVTTGATSASQCIANCDAGYYFNNTMGACQHCGIGFYQNLPGQDFCHQCPMGQVTKLDNSITCNDCFSPCPDGTQVMPGAVGECMNCSIGSYRKKGVEDVCMMCPSNLTTGNVGSVTMADCDLALCMDGYYRVGIDPGSCTPCPLGSYRAGMMNMSECMSCGDPMLYTTLGLNSTDISQCIRFCGAGYYYDDTSDSCVECPMGKYKPGGAMFQQATMCMDCPSNTPATTSLGSTSMANCTEACIAGQVYDLADPSAPTCKNCSVGYYQPIALPNTTDTCVTCKAGLTTATEGSTKESDCVSYCPSGQEFKNGACQDCAIGFWKNNNINPLGACTMCDNNMATPGTGATTIANCSQANCPAGNYLRTDTDCQPCPKDKYQDQAQQTSCKPCVPANYITKGMGSSSIQDCENPNKQMVSFSLTLNLDFATHGTIAYVTTFLEGILIARGVPFLTVTVLAVSPGSINVAADVALDMTQTTAEDITDAFNDNDAVTDVQPVNNPNGLTCTGGQELVRGTDGNATCSNCLFGTYQKATDINLCRTCKDGYNTSSEGSVEMSSCLRICDPGMEAKGGDTCNDCQADFYKVTRGVQNCTTCPKSTTTEGVTNATELNQCVANCHAGEKRLNNDCEDCGLDYYQPMANQTECIRCPYKLKTRGTRSTNEMDCQNFCQLYPEHCLSGGTCIPDFFTGNWTCMCNEPYSGNRCQTRGEFQSNTGLIIGAVLGGVGGILFLILLIVCVAAFLRKRSLPVPKPERSRNEHHARPEMYYPMGVAYPPEPLHMANPFAYDDPWGAQSQFAYSQTGIPWNHGNGYMANGGYHDGGFVPY